MTTEEAFKAWGLTADEAARALHEAFRDAVETAHAKPVEDQ